MTSKPQMDKIIELIKDGWKSDDLKNIRNSPLGSPIRMTKNGQELYVLPDGSTKEEEPKDFSA